MEATNKTLKYESSNEPQATVDDTGLITIIDAGQTKITVSATDGSNVKATCLVTIADPEPEVPAK